MGLTWMRLVTLSQAMNEIGRPRSHKLGRFLAEQAGIAVHPVSGFLAIAESDVPKLKAALKAWDERPRMSRSRQSVSAG